jgi:ABC-type nitrate/sulfonate/bicarbonate transport system permease component
MIAIGAAAGLPRAARGRLARPRPNWLGLLTAAVLVALWQLLCQVGVLHFAYLPSPGGIARGAGELWSAGTLQGDVLHTLGVTLLGWVIAAVIGGVLGFLLGLAPVLADWCMASFEVLRAVPGVTLAPLAVILLGFSIKMELVLVVYVSLWPVFMSTYVGARDRNPDRAEMARSLRMSNVAQVFKVIAPDAAAEVFVSLRLALSMALNLTVLAEMIGNPTGIGNGLVSAQEALQPGHMFAFVVLAGLLGGALNWLLMVLFRAISPGVATTLDGEVSR